MKCKSFGLIFVAILPLINILFFFPQTWRFFPYPGDSFYHLDFSIIFPDSSDFIFCFFSTQNLRTSGRNSETQILKMGQKWAESHKQKYSMWLSASRSCCDFQINELVAEKLYFVLFLIPSGFILHQHRILCKF